MECQLSHFTARRQTNASHQGTVVWKTLISFHSICAGRVGQQEKPRGRTTGLSTGALHEECYMRFNHGRMDRSCPPPLLWQLVSHSWDCYRCNPWLRLTSLADIPSPSHQIKKAPKTKRNQVTRSSNCLASQPKDSWTALVYNGLICYNDIIWYRFVTFCDALCSHVAICAHIQCFYILVHTCGLTTSHRRSWRLGAHLLSQCGVLKHKRGHIIFWYLLCHHCITTSYTLQGMS